ncbi:MAG: hypothetical protein CSA72_10710 [Rhodobacterales bacterium]|nr:MAG: hypothetical protein CSA72_10710 [Rhodobacterales bacterium]
MLAPGTPLTHWQVARAPDLGFDVPDQPMEGEMDSLFFLTKDRNVIPHTYPCRTAYIAQARDKKPTPGPAPDWTRAENWLPFGAPLLDLSGFWFRATRVSGWARTSVQCEADGPARLRLGTCGGALLFVNGHEAGWIAPATRNAMAEAEIAVTLRAGENDLVIWYDDLCERDARVLVSLVWEGGPTATRIRPYPAEQSLSFVTEKALSALHFTQPRYDSGEDITLTFPVPLPVDAQVEITIAGDFMSHQAERLTRTLPAGETRLTLGPARGVRADYRHFHIALTVDGHRFARTLGVEVSNRTDQGAAPATLPERIAEALSHIAAMAEPDTVRALACLATGADGAEDMIAASLPPIEECWDCADFALVPLLWARMAYGDGIDPNLRDRVDRAILGYRYWMDEPGNDVQWYFSENHALLFHTGAYLAGHLFPDAAFARSGRSGRDQSAVGRARVRAWLDHFETCEMAEFNSAPYFPIDLKGLCALHALAPDEDIRSRAAKGIARLVEVIANSTHQGVMTGAQGRSYEHTLCAGETLELSGIARMLWGRGSYGARVHALPLLALCLRDHGLGLPDLTDRACWPDPATQQEWTFQQGQNAFARLYHAKSAHTALGSAALYRWGDWGYQETLVHARIGSDPQAQVWINMPGELIQCGYGRPSYWGGSASVPRVQQYRDLAVVLFDGEAPQPDLTHAWFPTMVFDDWVVDGPRAHARQGKGHVMLAASGVLHLTDTGPSAGRELTLPGRRAAWVIRTGQGADFTARHSALAAPDFTTGALTINDADYGPVTFRPDGTVSAEGRTLDPRDWSLTGSRRTMPQHGA